ncbi:MAG: hypothetical protein GX794_01190, partial [Acholeplasmataceae bacterium]|nr:hypothetical protein [Acholeplasmataceae bacterium]
MEQFYVIGKVINVNQGANFYNINIEVEDKTLLNIKLNPDLTYEIIVGQIYRFLVKPEYKVNKENIIINNLVSYISIEKLADEVDLVSLYQIFYDFSPIDPVRARNLIEKTIENIDNQV